MGCCSSTPTADSPNAYPTDSNAGHDARPRDVSTLPAATASVLTSHVSRGGMTAPAGAPRTPTGQHNGPTTETVSSLSPASSYVPNKPLRPPPPARKVTIPASLQHHLASSSPALTRVGTALSGTGSATNAEPTVPRTPTTPRITRAQLRRERAAFFDTRWSGRAEVWAAVRVICDSLRTGDLATAQTLLDAAGLTCPSGEVWSADADMPGAPAGSSQQQSPGSPNGQQQRGWRRKREGGKRDGGVYDELGERYQVPVWVVADPEGVTEDDGDAGAGDDEISGAGADVAARAMSRRADTDDEEDDEDEDDIMLSKEKGKGREGDAGKIVRVKARLSDRGTDVVVKIGDEETVAALRRRIKEAAELPPRARMKVVYLGKIMSPTASLSSQGWREGQVVNALVLVPP